LAAAGYPDICQKKFAIATASGGSGVASMGLFGTKRHARRVGSNPTPCACGFKGELIH